MGAWLLLGIGLVGALCAAYLRRDLVAPHCPVCGETLEGSVAEDIRLLSYHRWKIGWRMFYCTQCLYRRRLVSISHAAEMADT